MAKINNLSSYWILDSRGYPTVYCKIEIETENNKYEAHASVPSGASTGSHEAVEIRDGGSDFAGKGVNKAVNNLIDGIGNKIIGKEFASAKDIDIAVLELESMLEKELGTESNAAPKSILGANAILAVSMAAHRAFAKSQDQELWQYLRQEYFAGLGEKVLFPKLMCNIFNGGAHASNNLDIQEFMIVPDSGNLQNDVKMASEIYQTLKKDLKSRGLSVGLGDEGGFASECNGTDDVLDMLEKSITNSGYTRVNCSLALDCAANEFFNAEDNSYTLDGIKYSQAALTEYYYQISEKHNILSIEDGFAEDDILSWELMTAKMAKKRHLVGDDLFVTNPERFQKIGLDNNIANAVLVKLNQIGTVYETCKLINLAKENSYATACSHRSGETNDSFIADLSVASGSEFIKLGAPARGERVAKYNRLLEIYQNNKS